MRVTFFVNKNRMENLARKYNLFDKMGIDEYLKVFDESFTYSIWDIYQLVDNIMDDIKKFTSNDFDYDTIKYIVNDIVESSILINATLFLYKRTVF